LQTLTNDYSREQPADTASAIPLSSFFDP